MSDDFRADRSYSPGRPLVKVCGLTSVTNAIECVEAGADWIGLNFHPASPRFVSTETAAEIVRALPSRVEAVGLFVDRPVEDVRQIAEEVGLGLIQLHGREPVADLARLAPLRVVRAFRLGDVEAVQAMIDTLAEAGRMGCSPHACLIDAHVPGMDGGTGKPIPSPILDQLPPLPRLILAGGLTPENVAERVRRVRPWMVDVASGVESSPGVKNPDAVRRFVAAARSADIESS